MSIIPKSAAARAYTRRLAFAMTLYTVFLLLAVHRLKHAQPSHAMAIFLSVLPSLPILAVLAIVGVYLREEKDEFQRELLIQAMLWGMGGTLAFTSVWGFLENFNQAPHFPAFYVFVIFWGVVGVAGCVQRVIYRGGGDD